MIELKLKEAQDCLNKIGHLASVQAREYAGDLNAQRKKIDALEKEKSRSNDQIKGLIMSAKTHEKENWRVLLAGILFGSVIGVAGAFVWMAYL